MAEAPGQSPLRTKVVVRYCGDVRDAVTVEFSSTG
jgi:hypothetical protein